MKNEFDYLNEVKMDFSIYDAETVSEKEIKGMKENMSGKKRKISFKKMYVIAACAAVVAIAGTAFASGVVGDIIKSVSTGYNNYVQTDDSVPQELPEELKGKIFDKNGIALEMVTAEDMKDVYDVNGEKIDEMRFAQMYEDALGVEVKISTENEYNADEAEKNYASIEEAQSNSVFDIKLPEYLPKGYELSRVYTYTDNEGNAGGKYITLEYKNEKGKEITIFERILDDETRFTTSTDGTLEELTINGRKAVLMDKNDIEWETDDNVSVSIIAHNISKSEIIKMAESTK